MNFDTEQAAELHFAAVVAHDLRRALDRLDAEINGEEQDDVALAGARSIMRRVLGLFYVLHGDAEHPGEPNQ